MYLTFVFLIEKYYNMDAKFYFTEAFMKHDFNFFKNVCLLAIPVALQSMLQSSFSMIDQIMIGQLGSTQVAAVGFAGKFSSIFSVMVTAIGAIAGIMISQYIGQKNNANVRKSFRLNLMVALAFALLFTLLSLIFPTQIMRFYMTDEKMLEIAASYLMIISGTFLPMAAATLFSVLFRCIEKAQYPLYASIASALLNTGLNYLFIFGKGTLPAMGVSGAAIATLISQYANCLIMGIMLFKFRFYFRTSSTDIDTSSPIRKKQYLEMLLPILMCEFMWSLGENVYAAIYGHMGAMASAAMTLTNPIQGLLIGALSGLSAAASVIIGKSLGKRDYDEAYTYAKKMILYGFFGSIFLSLLVLFGRDAYLSLYQVEASVKLLTKQVLIAYALIAPIKVQNMIVGSGVIRSGGKTNYLLAIDLIGTWLFGVPLGLFSAFVLKLSIPYVYFILSLEECVRYALALIVLKHKKWMQSL